MCVCLPAAGFALWPLIEWLLIALGAVLIFVLPYVAQAVAVLLAVVFRVLQLVFAGLWSLGTTGAEWYSRRHYEREQIAARRRVIENKRAELPAGVRIYATPREQIEEEIHHA